MMSRITVIVAIVLAVIFSGTALAYDGIPNNCEHAVHEDARNQVPRFVAGNSRLELVDWRAADVTRMVAEGISGVNIRDWSLDCRYIVISEWNGESTDTVVYDTHNSVRMGQVADAVGQEHPIQWGPDGYLMVETRKGAVLWHVPDGRQMVLTESFNYTRVRNFTQIIWDSDNNQVLVRLAMGGVAAFDLSTGAEHPLSDDARAQLGAGRVDVAPVYTPPTDTPPTDTAAVYVPDCEPGEEADIAIKTLTGSTKFFVGQRIAIYGLITHCVDYDLEDITAIFQIPVELDVLNIRVDPAQEYTDILDVAKQVSLDGIAQDVILHDPERTLKIEKVMGGCAEDEPMTQLTWVFTEGLSTEGLHDLRIDIVLLAAQPGDFILRLLVGGIENTQQSAEVTSDDTGCDEA